MDRDKVESDTDSSAVKMDDNTVVWDIQLHNPPSNTA